MSGADNLLIRIGVIAVAVSCFFFYRVLTDDNEFANEIREVKEKNSNPSQVGIFIFQNNNFIFESAKDTKEIKNNQIDHSAKVLFTLPGFEIDNSHNISSIIDNGTGDISIIFANDLPSKNYYTEISGNKNIEIYDIEKSKGYLRVKFNEKGIDYLQTICDAN